MFCKKCGKEIDDRANFCPYCGASVGATSDDGVLGERKSSLIAGVLQIILPYGIGRFYLGYIGIGLAQLLTLWIFGIGIIRSIIDGILILTGVVNTDAKGNALKY